MKRILVTGSGSSGSWRIRGEQLGAAIGADVVPRATAVQSYDLAILVKRPPLDLILRLQRLRVPIVWDVVDAWPQPQGNDWPERQCKAWLAERIGLIKPVAIVAATQAMAQDCAAFGVPVHWLPHHARPGLGVNPIRELVTQVGYEGGAQYLGDWRPFLEHACAARGWVFHVEPNAITDLDIVVALRDQRGYAPRVWKSNVKLANAQGSGTPIICNLEAGYLETRSGGEVFADTRDDVLAALEALTPHAERAARARQLLAGARRLEDVAAEYLGWLRELAHNSSMSGPERPAQEQR